MKNETKSYLYCTVTFSQSVAFILGIGGQIATEKSDNTVTLSLTGSVGKGIQTSINACSNSVSKIVKDAFTPDIPKDFF